MLPPGGKPRRGNRSLGVTACAPGSGNTAPLSLRDALREIWQADKYPILGNEDWREAERLHAEALERAKAAVMSPVDQSEFAALRDPHLPGLSTTGSCARSMISLSRRSEPRGRTAPVLHNVRITQAAALTRVVVALCISSPPQDKENCDHTTR